jgi:transmembrane protein EpsG
MIVYLLNYAITSTLSYISDTRHPSLGNSKNSRHRSVDIYVIAIIVLFAFIYAFRWKVGTDFGNYYYDFYLYGTRGLGYALNNRDFGFYVMTHLIYQLWPGNFVFYNLVLSMVTYVPAVIFIKRYSKDFHFSILLYISLLLFFWPFNGARQSIALGITLLGAPFLVEKRLYWFFLIVIIASFFHSTALIIIPITFLSLAKPWSRTILISLVVSVIIIIFLPQLWGTILSVLSFMGQTKLATDYASIGKDNGAHLLRVVVIVLPSIIAFAFRNKLDTSSVLARIIVNFSLIAGLFYLFALRMTVFARFANYFLLFTTLLVPTFEKIFPPSERGLYKLVTLGLYFIFMLLLLPVDSNLLPYRFIWEN